MYQRLFGALVLCGLMVAAPVHADVVMSTSNNPGIDIDPAPEASDMESRLDGLLGEARPEVRAARDRGMSRFLSKRRKSIDGTPLPEGAYTAAYLADQPAKEGGAQWRCLTEALYFEARGEDVKGIFAVAEVILNRVDSGRFPDSVCGVVKQGTGKIHACQFSYTCDGAPEVVHEMRAWRKVGKIATLMLDGAPRRLTDGATYYHTRAVSPGWSNSFDRTTAIGAHLFYRQA
ncbi:Cell wall hydrolase CwlJ, involved in spore germination [Tranquillimonas rosea]|uniref:Cell wall hydrolase CwlJ, involved in spore germination n=1 Tax=Tranquillimonas rosea TaxID=641238 RepID=A0A1H9WER2_9RHOB|nr:cell wall hydrolase [Tranquillimonas rosea]SES32400.1 Cell wall hydrolase CwlJ, involved in spore germination [Tranquillimonas rosea]